MFVLLLIGLVGGAVGQGVDDTRVSGTHGHAVVEASLDMIQETCIFRNDRLFFRRLSYVASNDGAAAGTYRPGYDGGIWQVNENMFQVTKSSSARSFLQHHIANITRDLTVSWDQVTWSDLRKPLYSALAARLYIAYQARSFSGGIPISTADQAAFWKSYYNPAGNVNDFITLSARLETGCTGGRGIDLAFVVDGSGSIGSSNFASIKSFMKDVIEAFDIGADKTRIGVIQYSSSSYVEFHFNRYFTNSSVLSAVNNIRYRGGGTSTYLALDQLRTNMYQVSNGARPRDQSHPRVAIVLTDGQSNYARTSAAAKRVHDEDITVLSIGVGSNLNMRELEAIASAPVCMHLSLLRGFTEIESLKHTIQKRSCDAPNIIDIGTPIGEVIPPDGTQNCKLRIPRDGVTVKVKANTGSVTFYSARAKYPNAAYYDRKIQSNGNGAALYVPSVSGGDEDSFCSIEGGNSTSNNVTIGVEPGDREWCRSGPCQNGGDCVDDGDQGYRCICPTQYEGRNCQNRIPPCRNAVCYNGATCVNLVGGYLCHCADGYEGPSCQDKVEPPPSSGQNCRDKNPCTADNINNNRFYHPHEDPSKFVQCSQWGQCFEMNCPAGLEWDQDALTCNWPKSKHCDPNPCQNGGTCTENTNGFTCSCTSGYTGHTCQDRVPSGGYNCADKNPCTPENIADHRFYHPHEDPNKFVQCSQWGQCFVMNCPPGLVWDVVAYTCNYPSQGTNYCSTEPCQNGGTCVNGASGYTCTCASGYTGHNCQDSVAHGGYNCGDNNPCTAENIENNKFYHPHEDPSKFVQCSQWGQCFVMPCGSGLVWDPVAYTCNRP